MDSLWTKKLSTSYPQAYPQTYPQVGQIKQIKKVGAVDESNGICG
ncbi:MAG: hypothetical protein AB7F43_02260 [Bacteriovoracia bacterium]